MAVVSEISEPDAGSLYEQVGGDAGVRRLVDAFYDIMDMDEDLVILRGLHGPTLDSARDKLYWFLCGWMGGPDLYVQRFGHPRLRARHLPFPIDSTARDQWVICMGRAMIQAEVPEHLHDRLLNAFFGVADWMRNREG